MAANCLRQMLQVQVFLPRLRFVQPDGKQATVAAGPVFRLLGARGIGEEEDYHVAKMPPVNTGLLDGELAWRQHDGGHEDRSNMSFFITWASRLLHHTPPGDPRVTPNSR
jgi:hypothetical protein